MKNFTTMIGFIMALATTSAQAIPTLYFDGNINYTAATGELSVSGALTGTDDIASAPILSGSTMIFSSIFDNAQSLPGTCFFCADSTKGNFIGNSDASINDLKIDVPGSTLLTAKFYNLSLEGADGGDRGEITGLLNATGGSLMNMFDNSNLFAFQLNLSSAAGFSANMYGSDFSGQVDGNIKGHNVSVPEPSILALLGFGILIISFARKSKSL